MKEVAAAFVLVFGTCAFVALVIGDPLVRLFEAAGGLCGVLLAMLTIHDAMKSDSEPEEIEQEAPL